MVASSEPTVVDFLLVVEATANMVSHWDSIKKSYVRPAVEYFNGKQLSSMDYIGNHGISQFGYVLFNAADTATEMSTVCSDITHSPWDFVHGLDSITFSGGGCEKCSHITEGLARALQLFDDLSEKRGRGKSKKVCFLVCNSPPYELPCYDNYRYAGFMYEKLAELIGAKGINLSVISPQHIREIKQIYLAANQNKAPIMSYAQDQRHLILISGFTLPTEQDPVKVEPEDKKTLVANNGSSVVTTSSMTSLSVQHSSPAPTFHQSTIPNLSAQSPGNLLFSSAQVTSSASEVKPCILDVQPAASTDLSQSLSGSVGPSSITTQSNLGLGTGASLSKSSTLMMQNSPANQRQTSLGSSSTAIPQSSSSLQRVPAQNLSATAVTVKSELNVTQRPAAEALIRAESKPFSVQSGNSNSMQQNNSGLTSMQQISLFGSQPGVQNVATVMSAAGSSSAVPKAPPYSTPNLNSGIQSSQRQQPNILISASSAGNIMSASSSTGSPANNLNQMPNRGASSLQQSMGQNTSNMIVANSNPSISNPTPNVQINQPIGRSQLSNQLSGSNMLNPVNSAMNINEQSRIPVSSPYPAASDVASAIMDQAAQQQYNEAGLLWRGILEWKEKRKVSTGNPERTVHKVRCEVLLRQNQADDTLNASLWPSSLTMQLVPQVVFTYRDMKVQIENNINVMLRMSPIDAMTQLISTMQTKWVGIVQIPSQNTQQAETRVMLIIYSQKNNQFCGLFPRDPVTFMNTIRQVIQHHHSVQRGNSSALPMSGQPSSELQPFSSDNRMNPNLSNANQFVMQSSRPNVNAGMRPMGHIPNPTIAGRGSMQTGVSSQQQRSLDLNYNQQSQQRMSMGLGNQPMVNSQMQQPNSMGQPLQQNNANQQIMYQNAMNQQRPIGARMQMNQNNDIMRQQHDMMRQQQRIRQQQQSQQNPQMLRMNQMQASHPGGQEQLRSLLQGSNMNQGMNTQHSNMHSGNQGMRQVQPSQIRPGYMPNQQQMHHSLQQNRMMGMQQQQRFGM